MSPGRAMRGCVLGGRRRVVRSSGRIPSAHERERTDADRGGFRRRRDGRRTLATADEANQSLDPRSAAQTGGHAAQPIPETPARPQQKRANGRWGERELGGELAVAEPADLAQEEGLALGGWQAPDLVPDGRELAGAQDVRGSVRGPPVRQVARRHRGKVALAEPCVALVARDRE